jgi:CRISPR-associated protein Cst1
LKLKLHLDDYLTAMGGVGLLRMQNWAHRNLGTVPPHTHPSSPIQIREDHLEIDTAILPHVPEWFFRYLMAQYSVSAREERRLKFTSVPLKDQMDRLKNTIQDNFKKLSKYFEGAEELRQMQECLECVKEMSVEQAAAELPAVRDQFLKLLRTDRFEEKLTLNVIRSILHNVFFGQVSFLQKTMSNFNLKQHICKMKEDYVDPLLFDIRLHELLKETIPPAEKHRLIVQHLQDAASPIHKRWFRELKKIDPEEVESYFERQLKCSFEEEWLATHFFEEKIFVPLGVSSANAYNFSWDLEAQSLPISSWIRFVLFLSPAGLTPFTKFINDSFETYYSFVMQDGSPALIHLANESLINLEQNETFDRLIPKIVRREEHKAKQEIRPDIQIIEFFADYGSKKTVMHYYHVPRHMLHYFEDDAVNKMHTIWDRSLRDPFLHLVMENTDPIRTIWNYLQKVVRGKARPDSARNALMERWKIKRLKEGKHPMNDAGIIHYTFKEGQRVRDGLKQLSDARASQTDYVSGGEKRAAGIAHRLLNSAKAGNRQQFLDTVIRLYLQVKLPVPTVLLNVLHEKNIDFESLSGAFITGLLSDDDKRTDQSDKQAENESAANL